MVRTALQIRRELAAVVDVSLERSKNAVRVEPDRQGRGGHRVVQRRLRAPEELEHSPVARFMQPAQLRGPEAVDLARSIRVTVPHHNDGLALVLGQPLPIRRRVGAALRFIGKHLRRPLDHVF